MTTSTLKGFYKLTDPSGGCWQSVLCKYYCATHPNAAISEDRRAAINRRWNYSTNPKWWDWCKASRIGSASTSNSQRTNGKWSVCHTFCWFPSISLPLNWTWGTCQTREMFFVSVICSVMRYAHASRHKLKHKLRIAMIHYEIPNVFVFVSAMTEKRNHAKNVIIYKIIVSICNTLARAIFQM